MRKIHEIIEAERTLRKDYETMVEKREKIEVERQLDLKK